MKGQCPACGESFTFARADAGHQSECPLCNRTITLLPAPLPPALRFWREHWLKCLCAVAAAVAIGIAVHLTAHHWATVRPALPLVVNLIAVLIACGAGVVIIRQFTIHKLWLLVASIFLVSVGLLLTGTGVLGYVGLMASKEATIFQSYETLFYGIGGLIIIALGLMLHGISEIAKNTRPQP